MSTLRTLPGVIYSGVVRALTASWVVLDSGALRLRAWWRGKFQQAPTSWIRGGTGSGIDEGSTGADAELPSEPLETAESSVAARRRPRVLIVCPYRIAPPVHGGAVRLTNLIRHLSRDCDLYLLVFEVGGDPIGAHRRDLGPFCKVVEVHDWRPCFDREVWDTDPPNFVLFRSDRLAWTLRDMVEEHGIDVVQLEYTELSQYRDAAGPAKVIVVEHDLAFMTHQRRRSLGFAERFPDSKAYGSTRLDGARQLRREVRSCRQADQVHMMSAHDGRILASYMPDGYERLRVVPNGVDCDHYAPSPGSTAQRRDLLFVGNYENLPNVDALEYFLAEIWPLIRQQRPNEILRVGGAGMPPSVLELDGKDGVVIVGEVDDMATLYHAHKALAVPLRAGSGTRLKILEAFAAGIPVVATSLAAEGIQAVSGEHLIVADDPQSFAAGLVSLLEDEAAAEAYRQAAMRLVRESYDWSQSAAVNLRGIEQLMSESASRELPTVEPVRGAAYDKPTRVSIVIPTLDGGDLLRRTLEGVQDQDFEGRTEIVCVDSGSSRRNLTMLDEMGCRVHAIEPSRFNHGLTRDLGASLAKGEVLVFINQDAVPANRSWLRRLVTPLFDDPELAAVQGGIADFDRDECPVRYFFWDSGGERFYFTRESRRWISSHGGLGFSTVNAALRRSVWEQLPFGWAPIMEDKKWQRAASERDLRIEVVESALVLHSHDYGLGSLSRRCESEGYGWRLLGESYMLRDMVADMLRWDVHRELISGIMTGRARTPAEWVFPWLRPWKLFAGNRFGRRVQH